MHTTLYVGHYFYRSLKENKELKKNNTCLIQIYIYIYMYSMFVFGR